MSHTVQRVVGLVVLLVAGVLTLPVVASFLDGQRTENWILPVGLVITAGIGAAVTIALPALAPAGAATTRRALVGAGWGVLASLCGLFLFWVLLNGLNGA